MMWGTKRNSDTTQLWLFHTANVSNEWNMKIRLWCLFSNEHSLRLTNHLLRWQRWGKKENQQCYSINIYYMLTLLSIMPMSCNHHDNMRDTASNRHCTHSHTAYTQRRLWMTCYLVISRKLRRVERSSRRLICLWHWLQKKSSASSLRKLWKQPGGEVGALERGNKEEEKEREDVVSAGQVRGWTQVGRDTTGVSEKSTEEFEKSDKWRLQCWEETWDRRQCGCDSCSG